MTERHETRRYKLAGFVFGSRGNLNGKPGVISGKYNWYSNNKADADDALPYSYTCLLQLFLNWI
jgi:hypothetical protein